MLTSCGSKAGGTGEFATVVATDNTTTSGIDSDVATWFDSATVSTKSPACSVTSVPTVTPDDVVFNVTSAPYTPANTGSSSSIPASDLTVTKITLTFTPANSQTPALPAGYQTQFPSAGQRITANATTGVSVRIAKNEMKQFLQPALTCAGLSISPVYSYQVSVSFDALELNTNRSGTITLPGYLIVNFSDYIDK